ncbi:hypothetical protein D3C87_1248930 [compost metagenome]
MGIRNGAGASAVFRLPLVGPRRALGQFPFVTEQVLQVVVAPLGWRGRPGHFQAAGDGVATFTGTERALPAQALQFEAGGFGLRSDMVDSTGTVGFAEGVTARDQRDGFLVVHGHARKGFTDVLAGGDRIGVAFRAFGVYVDQAHLHGCEWGFQIALYGSLPGIFAITHVATQPRAFRAPVDVFVRLPDIRAASGKTKGLEAHGLQCNVAGEDDQVGPGDFVAVLLLDWPKQPTGLVEADVVRPAVERCKALLAGAGAAPAVTGAIGACGVPGHADKKRPIVTEVRRPPVLGIGHQRSQVFFQRLEVQALEGFGVVEVAPQRVRLGRVLTQDLQVQLVRPPVAVRRATASGVIERAFRFS